MYSRAQIAGHPIHPMLIAYPVAGYTGTLVGLAVYAANGQQFWLNFAIAMNIAGVGGALLAALPGAADLALGVPRGSGARQTGLMHAGVNVLALALFAISLGLYAGHWNGPARSATPGLALASAGLLCTIAAGALGWMLVQDFHVGVQLTPEQQRDEMAVQSVRPLPMRGQHRRAA
ncbi:DUF2231 domain-containing protein [Streptacidiphilus monticola]|jgi:uncharacterized membrane protein|uniref:DUF2231 domain-containing protein n=1 Tax=Streptacidiphilus monticola TaxID=2161674 RepID=A0ABW1GBH8_9ACTN